ncbi:MAG: phosphoenolpyruvate carboxylase, partial [Candidatus Bathyarchaeia archaeon]
KDVDPNIVRKLLAQYPDFFKEHVLGRDVFLTYRVPNPSVEGAERKGLIEALESIPRCCDVARSFHQKNVVPPIFEVILPFTTSHLELLRVLSCYCKIIVGKGRMRLHDLEDLSVEEWVGSFEPKSIELIPLIEDKESLSTIDRILAGYIEHSKPPYLRVFLARSDPALNYSVFSAVLLSKIALSKIHRLSQTTGVEIFPIIGTGSLPFRGHLMPDNIEGFLEEYAGVTTVTVQSALKYDFPEEVVNKLVRRLNRELAKRRAKAMDEEEEGKIQKIVETMTRSYQKRVESLSNLINFLANYIPKRRARKLHIGLFGYSRDMGGVRLPRAIGFTASMYSLGIPPELLGVSALAGLSDEEWGLLDEHYVNWRRDLECASEFLCWQNLNYLMGEREVVEEITERFGIREVLPEIVGDIHTLEEVTGIKAGPRNLDHRKHENIVNNILIAMVENPGEITRYVVEAGRIRHSLG